MLLPVIIAALVAALVVFGIIEFTGRLEKKVDVVANTGNAVLRAVADADGTGAQARASSDAAIAAIRAGEPPDAVGAAAASAYVAAGGDPAKAPKIAAAAAAGASQSGSPGGISTGILIVGGAALVALLVLRK